MANLRFHEKYHATLHHTAASPEYPGSATDPIASRVRPFTGDFFLSGSLSGNAGITLAGQGTSNAYGRLGLSSPVDDLHKSRIKLPQWTGRQSGINFGDDNILMYDVLTIFF